MIKRSSKFSYTSCPVIACPFDYNFLEDIDNLFNFSTKNGTRADAKATERRQQCPKLISAFFPPCCRSVSEADRSSLSEPDAAEEEETENELHQATNRGAGKALSQTEIPGVRRAGGAGEIAEDDGRAGEDLVPEQADEMEVSDVFIGRAKPRSGISLRGVLSWRLAST